MQTQFTLLTTTTHTFIPTQHHPQQAYEKNLKRGQLTDNTIMLWNDSALQEVKIPAGPRLLILHHIDQYRHLLKPAGPLP